MDKLKTVDLSKSNDVVNNDVVKKTVYDKLVAKVNNIDISGFVLKTKYDTDKSDLEKKIFDTSELVKKQVIVLKLLKQKVKYLVSATTSVLTAVENKIPNISGLAKKTDYNTKISEIEKKLTDHNHDKYITNPQFNKLSAEVFDARLAQADFDDKSQSKN